MLSASITFGSGIVWITSAYLIGFLGLCAWALCRAAKLGDEQQTIANWEIDDDEIAWHDWPGERAA